MREKGRQSLLQVNTTSTSLPRSLDSIAEGRDETESEDAEEVDWDKLQEKEDATPKTPGDDDTTALLLARLEQENAKLAAQPKTIQSPDHQGPPSSQKSPIKQIRKSRPPSMAQLRQMVRSPIPQNLRYSQIEVPQMTDLEFYAAVVQDYQQAAARFPTLLSHKIRKGIPPPLRGVVWQSMAGARDPELEGQFDHLCNQDSPYERIIGKDLGRSFPGVDMFRDSNGEGQKKLGRVLKCLSVYDPKIGYCQGLAFVVGPLLMHMPDKQAFCVLVKLMERYDLRSSYQPDLAGLHARIFQFRSLLQTMVPNVASHLENLQVEAAYVSQWFLSVFAVTCPLPMLFRMYDVLFAEGAHETLMRVALSLMKKNEERILACREMEDAMQLLLSRGLWDCYHYNADEFVNDFVALSDAVTREKLQALEEAYLEQAPETFPSTALPSALPSQTPRSNGANACIFSISYCIILCIAVVFFHCLCSKHSQPRSCAYFAPADNSSILSSASTTSTSTEATTVSISSRDSVSVESTATILPSAIKTTSTIASNAPKSPSILSAAKNQTDERYLHNQIEDLLAALTQLQLNHAILSSELEKERDERDEDKRAVQALLIGLRQKPQLLDGGSSAENDSNPGYTELLHAVEKRFALSDIGSEAETNEPATKPSLGMSKADLEDELRSAKDQMNAAKSQSQEFQRKIYALDNEVTSLRDQLKDCQTRMRTMHQDKQRMEKQLQTMRQSRSSAQTTNSINVAVGAAETIRNAFNVAAGVPGAEADKPGGSGLRELRLGRGPPSPSQSQLSRRASSIQNRDSVVALSAATAAGATPTSEQDALLLQLVQAKTGEAMAKQEVEELRQKLDSLKKQYGIGDLHTPNRTNTAASAPVGSGSGGFWGGWRR
ncbi:Rab GTPase-activating protein 1-like protein [Ceratocystis platani]|uniref:Rab GTPase-activating protein 1-like protein n=1 Tax=Ceratocystis fimbriata f. sp. platani TaxID=88771 RepID=A0A0F8B0G2_CERFI|nr:Rab GTPase-activating protein 1-like protein [Ceratocystis platani]